jgi:hypothetical protein
MSAFELTILILGAGGLIFASTFVLVLGIILHKAFQNLDKRLERLTGELVRLSGQLRTIQESFQYLDKQ